MMSEMTCEISEKVCVAVDMNMQMKDEGVETKIMDVTMKVCERTDREHATNEDNA